MIFTDLNEFLFFFYWMFLRVMYFVIQFCCLLLLLSPYVKMTRDYLEFKSAISIFSFYRNRIRMFPAFVNCTTIDWFSEWPAEALLEVADKYLSEMHLGNDEAVSTCALDAKTYNRLSLYDTLHIIMSLYDTLHIIMSLYDTLHIIMLSYYHILHIIMLSYYHTLHIIMLSHYHILHIMLSTFVYYILQTVLSKYSSITHHLIFSQLFIAHILHNFREISYFVWIGLFSGFWIKSTTLYVH